MMRKGRGKTEWKSPQPKRIRDNHDVTTSFSPSKEEIVKLLEHGELCVCDIVAALEMVQPKVSFHIAVLKEAGFIRDRKQGKRTHYRLADSDLLRRSLTLSVSVIERIPVDDVAADTERLKEFLNHKPVKGKVAGI
jgi:ArsR family transcriptional regulator